MFRGVKRDLMKGYLSSDKRTNMLVRQRRGRKAGKLRKLSSRERQANQLERLSIITRI